jgi:sugar-specific transcriptional regulator TrmB
MSTNKNNFLAVFGFNDKEYELYYLLVTYGPLTISDIVNKTNLHRPYAYKTVQSLIEKEAVHQALHKSKKVYIATSPTKLKAILEDKKEKSMQALDTLEELYVSPHIETSVKHYQGRAGVTAIFRDLVTSQKKGDIFYRYTSEKDTEYTDTFLPKEYRAIRDKKGLERFVISTLDIASKKQKRLERATKVIPKNEALFNQDCIQLIYGDKIAFIDIAQIQGVIIENKNLAQFQKEIFKMLYKRI